MESVITLIRTIKLSLLTISSVVILTTSGFAIEIEAAVKRTMDSRAVSKTPVLSGIDVSEKNGFRQLENQRIGLITNQTGINRSGINNIQLLHEAPNVNLVAIFSPEHGLFGKLDIESIDNSQDALTGIEVFSLYGNTRTPTVAMLSDIDTLVFDIQDIGTRFYTYISTMGEAMKAAAQNGVRFVVLDRPNPINGVTVSGPILDDGSQSFVGFHTLPVRHGMTVGELALMFNTELKLGLELKIIRLEGWHRQDYFDATGLQWVNPSPNMRNLTEAILYPGIGLLETTNLSVGRGTPSPFELIGAPWIDGHLLADKLNRLELPGILFKAIQFTPDSSKFKDQVCGGVSFIITQRDQFKSVQTGIEIALQLLILHPDNWETGKLNRLLSNKVVLEAIRSGLDFPDIDALYRDKLADFMARRATYLIYQ